MKKFFAALGIFLIVLLGMYLIYKKNTGVVESDLLVYGEITKIEMWYPLDNIEPKVIIYRMSKFPKKRGRISIIPLEKYLKGLKND